MSHFNGHCMSLQMVSGFPVEWLEAVRHFRGLAKGTSMLVGKVRTGDALSLSGLPQGGVICSRGVSMIFSKSEEEALVKWWLSLQKEDLRVIHDRDWNMELLFPHLNSTATSYPFSPASKVLGRP